MRHNRLTSKPVLAAFDFDGTLTYRDSFTLFLKTELGFARYSAGLRRLSIPTFKHLTGFRTRDQLKEDLIRHFLTGFSVAELVDRSDYFCSKIWPRLMRPNALKEVEHQLQVGATVTLCSASPEIVLRPFAKRLGVSLIATRLEEHDGVLTGGLQGKNCRQAEKVARLAEVHGDLSLLHLRGWGDTAGDKQMLEAAQERYYRWFH